MSGAVHVDAAVICDECERVQLVDFSICLRFGWPQCHEHTMRLLETNADCDSAVGEQFAVEDGFEPDPERMIAWPPPAEEPLA